MEGVVNPYAPCINTEMVLKYNSQQSLNTSNGFKVNRSLSLLFRPPNFESKIKLRGLKSMIKLKKKEEKIKTKNVI